MSKKTVKAIVVGGNDYVIQVKGNQPKLKKAIEEYTEKNNINDKYINKEMNRGRIENREICVYKSVEGIEFAKWVGLKDIIVVHRWGE